MGLDSASNSSERTNSESSTFSDQSSEQEKAFLALGDEQLQNKAYNLAIKSYKSALSVNPNSTKALEAISEIYLAEEKYPSAISTLSKLIKIEPNNPEYYYKRGIAHFKNENASSALSDLNKTLALKQDNAKAMIALGEVTFSLGHYDEATQHYDHALLKAPQSAEAFMGLGNISLLKEEYPIAIEFFTKAIALEEANATYYATRGKTYCQMNAISLAAQDAKKALELDQNNAVARIILGEVEYHLDKYDRAIEYYAKALSFHREILDFADTYSVMRCDILSFEDFTKLFEHKSLSKSDNSWKKSTLSDGWAQLAKALAEKNNIVVAISAINEALRLDKNNALYWILSAEIKCLSFRFLDSAIQDYERALTLQPHSIVARTGRGWAYSEKKQYQLALADLTEALTLNPNYIEALDYRAQLYQRQRNHEAAEKDKQTIKEASMLDAKNYCYRAKWYLHEGKENHKNPAIHQSLYEKAIEDFSNAIRQQPDNLAIYWQRAEAYKDLKKYALAILDLNKIMETYTTVDLYFDRARLLRLNKQFENAASDYSNAISLGRNNDFPLERAQVYIALGKYNEALEALNTVTQNGIRTRVSPKGFSNYDIKVIFEIQERLETKIQKKPDENLNDAYLQLFSMWNELDSPLNIANWKDAKSKLKNASAEVILPPVTGPLPLSPISQKEIPTNTRKRDNTNISEASMRVEPLPNPSPPPTQPHAESSNERPQKMAKIITSNIPEQIYCPITSCIMQEPVVADDGYTYEREAIEQHLNTSLQSPLLPHIKLSSKLILNRAIKSLIDSLIEKNDSLRNELYFSKAMQEAVVNAIKNGQKELLQNLIIKDKRILTQTIEVKGQEPDSLLSLISLYGNKEIFQYVFEARTQAGIMLHGKDACKLIANLYRNPLFQLSLAQDCISMIIEKANWQEQDYYALLSFSIEFGDDNLAKWSANQIKNIDYHDESRRTFLHRAVSLNRAAIVQILLEKKINLSSQDREGKLALHYVAENGNMELAKLLLRYSEEQKANINVLDSHDKTPKQIAEARGFKSVADLFQHFVPKEYRNEVVWVKNLSLFYKKEKTSIPADSHIKLRSLTHQKQKDGNVVHAQLTFLYKIKHESFQSDPYKLHTFSELSKPNGADFHVSIEYKNKNDAFFNDLKRYHPTLVSKIEQMHQANDGRFARKFHHSERAIFKHLENPTVIKHYVEELANQIQINYHVNPKDVKVIAAILDMHSTRYLCDWCEPAMHYFQNPQSLFMKALKDQLENLEFTTPQKHDLYMVVRYSAEMPAGSKPAKEEKDHKSIHEMFDIKDYRNRQTCLILQRDNVTTKTQLQIPSASLSSIKETHSKSR